MRMRKNAKVSPLVYAASYLKPGTVIQTHNCQLNQSPWDVVELSPPSTPLPPPPPPPSSQVDVGAFSAVNGSSSSCISFVESVGRQWEHSDVHAGGTAADKPPDEVVEAKEEEIIRCSKTDGKSWQCPREAAEGNSLCEHHLSLLKNYCSLAHVTTKKSRKQKDEARRPTRPRKAPGSSSSDPHEFYYYSGFGPRWGKKRGENTTNNGFISVPDNFEHEDELKTSTLASQTSEDEFRFVEDQEDVDENEDKRENGKKKVRKPVKARSLKSLM